MLFTKDHYGLPISQKLSNYLTSNLSEHNYANVATKTGVGLSTIKYVAKRTNVLTERNAVAIIDLMRIAIHNCEHKMFMAKEAKDYLTTKLKSK